MCTFINGFNNTSMNNLSNLRTSSQVKYLTLSLTDSTNVYFHLFCTTLSGVQYLLSQDLLLFARFFCVRSLYQLVLLIDLPFYCTFLPPYHTLRDGFQLYVFLYNNSLPIFFSPF